MAVRRNATQATGRAINVAWMSALVLLVMLAVFDYGVFGTRIAAMDSAATVMNLSGRQRLLSRRVATLSRLLAASPDADQRRNVRASLVEMIALMQRTHDGLRRGDEELGLPGAASDAVVSIYDDAPHELDSRLRAYLAAAAALAATQDAQLSADNADLRTVVEIAADSSLLGGLQALVAQYQLETSEDIRTLVRLDRWLLTGQLALFAFIALAIFRPMSRRVRRQVDELEVVNDELARQAQALHTAREEAVARMEDAQRLANLVDSSDDAIVGTALDGTVTSWNAGAEQLYGYRAEEVVGRDATELVVPEQLVEELATIRHRLGRGERVRNLETVRRRKDETIVDISLTISLIEDVDGRVMGTSTIARDISERKQAEREIERRSRELETLLHVVSHDLREPLRSIESFSTAVQERYGQQLDGRGRDLLERVAKAGARMRRLLMDIMRLSRARAAATSAHEVDAGEVVVQTIDRLGDRIGATGASVEVVGELPILPVDKAWVDEVVYNLVANALKFTVDDAAPAVTVSAYRPGRDEPGTIGLMVADRGPGVPPESAERIFNLFQRGVGYEVEGTGAGLAIVRAVAECHGGSAWMRPRDGGGSAFYFTVAERGGRSQRPDPTGGDVASRA